MRICTALQQHYSGHTCFSDVVCKAVLTAITHIEYAAGNADDYVPPMTHPATFTEAMTQDPTATIWSLIRGVCLRNALIKQY